jgi:hypothetical protein
LGEYFFLSSPSHVPSYAKSITQFLAKTNPAEQSLPVFFFPAKHFLHFLP